MLQEYVSKTILKHYQCLVISSYQSTETALFLFKWTVKTQFVTDYQLRSFLIGTQRVLSAGHGDWNWLCRLPQTEIFLSLPECQDERKVCANTTWLTFEIFIDVPQTIFVGIGNAYKKHL